MIALRPYQRDALKALLACWTDDAANPLVAMATGTGKTVVIATLVRELILRFPHLRVLMLVHVKELIEQNARTLRQAWPQAPLGINCAGLGRRNFSAQILYAGIQSVFRHDAHSLCARDLVVIDEAHLVPRTGEGMYRRLIEKLRARAPGMRVAGFTATPYRIDSGRLDRGDGRLFDRMVYRYDIDEGVRDGWLAPLIVTQGSSEIDVSGVECRGGEFVASALADAADKRSLVAHAADEMTARGASRRAWLVFCAGVDHAVHTRNALRARGIACETVSGVTPKAERDRIVSAYRQGALRCLTSANLLTTGFDVPQVDLIAMLRPTLSPGLYVQTIGRGTRLAKGKTDCLVLDFAGNARRHGPVEAISSSIPGKRT